MSDNRRVYRTIRKAIQQLYPKSPKGNLARHLNTHGGLGKWYCARQELPIA